GVPPFPGPHGRRPLALGGGLARAPLGGARRPPGPRPRPRTLRRLAPAGPAGHAGGGADPLRPDGCCARPARALRAGGRAGGEPRGTGARASSHYFGGLSARPAASQIEIRAAWTRREGLGGVPDTAAHLASWCDLLAQVAGLPPA